MRNKAKVMRKSILLSFCCLFILGACATKGVPPVKEIATVEKAINVARDSNAKIYAPLELRYAEEKLNQAKAAFEREEYDKARQLTEEASMDAKFAEAKALSEKEKKLVQETKDSIQILRNEIERIHKIK